MDITQKNRTDLKLYFVKNAIPTESNFSDLIDAMLNQNEDGITKLAGNPLSIEATGDATSLRKAINFYESFGDANPAWAISLNPRTQVNDPTTAMPGFAISDPTGANRLFIDKTSGNIGIGTIAPQKILQVEGATEIHSGGPGGGFSFANRDAPNNGALDDTATAGAHWIWYSSGSVARLWTNTTGDRLFIDSAGNVGIGAGPATNLLDISGAPRSGFHPTNRILYVTGNFLPNDGIEFRHSNSSQGMGFGYNTIYAAGTNPSQDLNLQPRGAGAVNITQGVLTVPGGLIVEGATQHINRDGALYRNVDGQVYLTVDDNLYVRQSAGGVTFHFDINAGYLVAMGRGNEQVYIGGDGYGNDAQVGSLNSTVTNLAAYNPSYGYMNMYARSFPISSDLALKKNIAPISNVLEKISGLRGVHFDWKNDKEKQQTEDGSQGNHLGFIAQEVREVFPEIVSENRGYLSVAYTGLIPVLVEAIKELKSRIDRLEHAGTAA